MYIHYVFNLYFYILPINVAREQQKPVIILLLRSSTVYLSYNNEMSSPFKVDKYELCILK